jgi:hypothetical protein
MLFILTETEGEVVASFDINTVANSVYKLISLYFKHELIFIINFYQKKKKEGIDSLAVEDIEKYKVNSWLISPYASHTQEEKSQMTKTEDKRGFFICKL